MIFGKPNLISLNPSSAEFNLSDLERPSIAALTSFTDTYYSRSLDTSNSCLSQGSWIGGFLDEDDSEPAFLFQTSRDWNPASLELDDLIREPSLNTPVYTVGQRSRTLIRCKTNDIRQSILSWPGIFSQVWVSQVDKHKSSKKEYFVYFGRIDKIQGIDPVHWAWNGAPFVMYTAIKGRELLVERTQLRKSIPEKWHHERDIRFHLN